MKLLEDKLKWIEHSIGQLRNDHSIFKLNPLTRETRLEDLDIDSLDIVELQMMYEDDTGTLLPDDIEIAMTTVGDLLDILK